MARTRRRRSRSLSSVLVVLGGLVVLVLLLRGGLAAPGVQSAEDAPLPAARHAKRVRRTRTLGGRLDERAGSPVNEGSRAPALSVHLALGVPVDRDPSDDYLVDEREFELSYNPKLRVPNWVAWKLNAAYLGHARRRNDFRADPSLPALLYHVTSSDYAHSGYDRGHMCPSGDRTGTEEENGLTFLMSNMEPQLHELNAGPWEKLEDFERVFAERTDEDLYIVAGGVFAPVPTTIGHGVAVPKANFKIIVAVPRGVGASGVTASTLTLAVVMPNERGVGAHAWSEYLTTIDQVEADTGYDFLPAVQVPVQAVIEARVGKL